MSDILIKGMEMPTSCRDCGMKVNCDECEGWEVICVPLHHPIGYYDDLLTDKRRDDCPLVPVPKHGRLIDADALIKEIDKQENAMYEHGHEFSFSFKSGGDVCTAWYNVEMMVEDAPTIIPASEEGKI